MVASGDIIGAQTLILKELETQFGGSAKAARNTLGGALAALGNAWGDLFEIAGPASESLRLSLEGLVTAFSDPAFVNAIQTIGTGLFNALSSAAGAVVSVTDAFLYAKDVTLAFADVSSSVWDAVASVASVAANAIAASIDIIGTVFKAQMNFMIGASIAAYNVIKGTFEGIAFAVGAAIAGAINAVIVAVNLMVSGVTKGVNAVISGLNTIPGVAIDQMTGIEIPLVEQAFKGAGTAAANSFQTAFDAVGVDYLGNAGAAINDGVATRRINATPFDVLPGAFGEVTKAAMELKFATNDVKPPQPAQALR